MVMLLEPFNPHEVENPQFEIVASSLPVGTPLVTISSTELTPTKDGKNGMLVISCEGAEGDAIGCCGMIRLNLYHEKPNVRAIANRQLAAICHATGIFDLSGGTEALHGAQMRVKSVLQAGEQAAEKGWTEIKDVMPAHTGGAQQASNWGQQQAQPAQQAQGAPWGNPPSQAQQAQQAQQAAPWGQPGQQPGQSVATPPWGKQ